MLASTIPSAVAQAMRACGRNLPTSRVLARRTFLIPPSYKARVGVHGYATATATATATKKAPAAGLRKPRIAPAKKSATAKKAAPKAKPKAKKAKATKVVKKKPAAPKREISPERKAMLEKRELKKVALLHGEPKRETVTLWTTYVTERLQSENSIGPGNAFGDVVKRLAVDFKSLSSSEKSRMEQKNLENKAINAANYKKWVESHTVEEIYKANLARTRLTRVYDVKTRKIVDERMPRRPTAAFAYFVKAKIGSHNDGQNAVAALKEMSAVWNSLSAADKKPYQDLMLADKSRYVKEMEGTGLPAPRL